MAILIELLNAQGKVTERHKFSQAHISIGRGYDNDVILLDPHSCAEHATLSLDEQQQWQLRDLDSVNGVLSSAGQRVTQQPVTQSGQEFVLGKQRLRIVFSEQPVAPTQVLQPANQLMSMLASRRFLMLVLVFCALISGYDLWLEAIGKDKPWSKQLLYVPLLMLAVALWPLLLALLSKITGHEARLRPQLALIFSSVLLWTLWDTLDALLQFNAGNSIVTHLLGVLVPAAILLGFFALTFTLASVSRPGLKWGLTLTFCAAYWLLPWLQVSGPNYAPQYNSQLLPAAFLLREPADAEQFIQDTAGLFDAATAEAKRKTDDH